MPTYEYRCNSCGHQCDIFQSIKDRPLRKCPACAKLSMKRLIGSGAGIIFRGSGFYETDYRSESYLSQARKESSSASEASADTGKTEKSSPKKTTSKTGTGKKDGKMKAAG